MTQDELQLRAALQDLVADQPFQPDRGAIERRGRQARRRTVAARGMAGTGLAAIAAATVVAAGAFSTGSGGSAPAAATPQRGALLHLAADIRAQQAPQPGDATLVRIESTFAWGGHQLVYELDADNGKDYVAASTATSTQRNLVAPERNLPAQIDGHDSLSTVQSANLKRAGLTAYSGSVTIARRQMAEASLGIGAAALSTKPVAASQGGEVPVDSWIWHNSVDELQLGAGDPRVRVGVLRLLATLPNVTIADTTTAGHATFTLHAGKPEAGISAYEILVIDARTGAPVSWTLGPGTHPAESTTTYQLRRVTISAIAAGNF